MKKISQYLILSIIVNLLFSCVDQVVESVEINSQLIKVSKSQFEMEKMIISEPKLILLEKEVNLKGKIVPKSHGRVTISLPLEGIVRKINIKHGESVVEGEALFEIGGERLIDVQKDFAESSAKIMQLKIDFDRTKKLYEDDIKTEAQYAKSQSAYKSELAKYNSLKIKLRSIGLSARNIENGNFYSSYIIKSPINGHITAINITRGQFIGKQKIIAEVVDETLLQLRLSAYEKDISNLEVNQNVEFFLGGSKDLPHKAKLRSISKSMNPKSKAIDCYAEIINLSEINLVNEQHVNAYVRTDVDSVYTVLEQAILKSNDKKYLLQLIERDDDTYYFNKIEVKTGRSKKGLIEILDNHEIGEILSYGAYNIVVE